MGVKKRLFPHGIAGNHTPACLPPVCLPPVCLPQRVCPSMSVISISAISVSAPSCLSPAVSRQMAECQAKVSPITGRIRGYKALRTEIQASRD